MQATIKTVIEDGDDGVKVEVEYSDGKDSFTKAYTYSSVNLQDKQQVLDMVQSELKTVSGFNQVVEDLKAEIDRPIETESLDE